MEPEKVQQKINEIYNFLFGSPSYPDKISLVSKINLMFDEIGFLKKSFYGSIITILMFSFYLGGRMYKLDDMAHESLENSQKNDIILKKIENIEHEIKIETAK